MFLDPIEFLFQWVGKFAWSKARRIWGGASDLSQGGNEVLGFVLIVLAAVTSFVVWGVIYA